MKASVIVLSWNGMEYLGDCLSALLSQDYPDFEVIVVDNGSSDGSADLVTARFPQARLIRNGRNLGFAGGNNVGLQAATGDVMVLLNQDTVVQPGWLGALVEALSIDSGIGIVGGKALYPDGIVQHAGGYVNERGEGSHYGYQQQDAGQFDQARDVDYVTGAALAITRRAFGAVGGLDEGFAPAYYEDVDWCYQVRRAGFRVVYTPQAVLIHKEASAVTDVSHERMCVFHRNRLRFVLKHWLLDRLVDEFVPAERTWLENLDEGGERLVTAMHRAYLHHLLDLADLLAWRRKLLGISLDEADALADALLTLRTVVPLKPARIASEQEAALEDPGFATVPERSPVQTLGELRQRWAIQEHEFHSHVPIFGPLIAAFRRQWNRVSTEWYVRPIIQQQSEFNAGVITVLENIENRLIQQEYDRQRLGRVLAEYTSENGRELGELARELRRLRASLEEVTR